MANIPTGKFTVHKQLQDLSKAGQLDLGKIIFLHEHAEPGDQTADEIFNFIDCILHDREIISKWVIPIGVITLTTNVERTHTTIDLLPIPTCQSQP